MTVRLSREGTDCRSVKIGNRLSREGTDCHQRELTVSVTRGNSLAVCREKDLTIGLSREVPDCQSVTRGN